MTDKSKAKRKKGSISEEDISTVLQKYSVNTILALLQEVSHQDAASKIDWNELVRNTCTGISCPREYQMLWRNLAYGQTLFDHLDNNDPNPLDDDSDLEYEQEAVPAVGREASAEAAACVKVLMASVPPKDSDAPNNTTVEAPLTINVPNIKQSIGPSDSSLLACGTNISIPVFVPKVPLTSGICGEKRPNTETTGVNYPPRRKRKAWSTEEDMKLTAAVHKCGNGNWAKIERTDFENERKASELAQRWGSLKKKQGNMKVGSKVGTSSQNSESRLADAHRAMSLAIDMPMGEMKPTTQISIGGTRPLHQAQKPSASLPDQHLPRPGVLKSQFPVKRLPSSMNPTSGPDSMVKAAAVAAGARIATSADASSLLEAARSQNVVHITTGGSSVMKPSSATRLKNQLPSNVHFISNGLAKAPISTYSSAKPTIVSRPGENLQAQVHSIKPAQSAVQPNQGKLANSQPAQSVPVQNASKLANSQPTRSVPVQNASKLANSQPAQSVPLQNASKLANSQPAQSVPVQNASKLANLQPAQSVPVQNASNFANSQPAQSVPVQNVSKLANSLPAQSVPVQNASKLANSQPAQSVPVQNASKLANSQPAQSVPVQNASKLANSQPAQSVPVQNASKLANSQPAQSVPVQNVSKLANSQPAQSVPVQNVSKLANSQPAQSVPVQNVSKLANSQPAQSVPVQNASILANSQPAQSVPVQNASNFSNSQPAKSVPVQNVSKLANSQPAQSAPVQNVCKLAKTAQEAVVTTSGIDVKDVIQRNEGAEISTQSKEAQKHENSVSDNALKENSRGSHASIPLSGPSCQTQHDQVALPCSEVETSGKKSTDDQHANKEINESPAPSGKEILDEK